MRLVLASGQEPNRRGAGGKLDGRVALITGGARGQGRSHAVALAREGADVVVCDDIGEQIGSAGYPLGTGADLAETVELVKGLNRRCLGVKADVHSLPEMQAVAERTVSELGHIDILLANAGIASNSPIAAMTGQQWREMIDVNLTGVFHSFRAVVPHMIDRGFGRIVATSPIVARMGATNSGHYAAAKWGAIGLVKSLALEVAADGITVNAVLPAGVNTDFIHTTRRCTECSGLTCKARRGKTSCPCSRRVPGCWSQRTLQRDHVPDFRRSRIPQR